MTTLTLQIPDDLSTQLKSHLSTRGEDLSTYVSTALRRQLFWDTVDAVRKRNDATSSSDIEADVAQALSEVRANRH